MKFEDLPKCLQETFNVNTRTIDIHLKNKIEDFDGNDYIVNKGGDFEAIKQEDFELSHERIPHKPLLWRSIDDPYKVFIEATYNKQLKKGDR